ARLEQVAGGEVGLGPVEEGAGVVDVRRGHLHLLSRLRAPRGRRADQPRSSQERPTKAVVRAGSGARSPAARRRHSSIVAPKSGPFPLVPARPPSGCHWASQPGPRSTTNGPPTTRMTAAS